MLAGGESAEREVSLRSGAAVAAGLVSAGHRVRRIDPADCRLEHIDWSGVDVCFIALHGGAGEDGRVQQQLESLGVPYTGSGPQACRLAMSKSAAKRRFVECGVPTPAFVLLDVETPAERLDGRVAPLGYPLVVKPESQGSSIGVSLVKGEGELGPALTEIAPLDRCALAEALVRGREFTLAVLDEEPLPLLEIVAAEPIFSYEAKYASSLTEYRLDFELDAPARAEITRVGLAAAHALGTAGLARVDVMLDQRGAAWVLEVNTVPGMTERSLAPQAARRAGLEFPALVDHLVRHCRVPSAMPCGSERV